MIELGKDDVFVVEIREKEGKEENHMWLWWLIMRK